MAAELVLSMVSRSDEARGPIAAFAVTDQQVVAVGARVLASPVGALGFAPRGPAGPDMHDVLAVGDALWACGAGGWLAVSRDHGERWQPIATGTTGRLRGLALGADGAVWVVGEAGYAARVLGEAVRRVDLGVAAGLGGVRAVRDELVALGDDGRVVRWRDGAATSVACGASAALRGLTVTSQGTWIAVGDDGFVARSPDGAWYSRVSVPGGDWRAIAQLAGGALVLAGDQLMASGDDGRTWRVVEFAGGAGRIGALARFAGGALIGSERGAIARLTVEDRAAGSVAPSVAAPPVVHRVTPVQVAPEALRAVELDATPVARWHELAWQWLDDGDAQRALLARLMIAAPAKYAQLASVSELRFAGADARAARIRSLATELSPVVEAILAGVVVRGDALQDVLSPDGDDEDERSPGWAAIDRALRPIYGDAEPRHYGTIVPYTLGGNDPIHGISAYPRAEPVPHWHFVTYGFTELFRKQNEDPATSGYGFELTFRLARSLADDQPPLWALNFLQNLGRYVFSSGNAFAVGHKMGLNSPIALDRETRITAICFADDPELGDVSSAHGGARFVQIVGITDDEYRLIQEWSTPGLLEILNRRLPFLVTDLERGSVLDDPATAAVIHDRVEREGSSEGLTFAGELQLAAGAGQLRMEVGALYAVTLPRAMRGRIRHGRDYELRGQAATLRLEPGEAPGFRREGDGDSIVLTVPPALAAEIEAALGAGLAGTYTFPSWDRLTIRVTPSVIRDQAGAATDVKGVRDPDEVAWLLAEDRAKRAQPAGAEASRGDDGDDDENADDDDPDEAAGHAAAGGPTASPARVAAALAMTTRALRLAPDSEDTQFAHGMLLLDAHRAGDPAASARLLAALAGFAPATRTAITTELARAGHPGFAEAAALVLAGPLPEPELGGQASPIGGGAGPAAFGDVAQDLIEALAKAILDRAPALASRLVPRLPGDADLLAPLAEHALQAGARDAALAIWERLLATAIPAAGDDRQLYLRCFNNACVQAHAAAAYDTAVRLADHVQAVADENPHLYHAAACAYAAVRDHARALEQVVLAMKHDYEHVARIETDADLGELLDWPDFQAVFRDWHARQEGN